MQIRRAQPADAPALARIHVEGWQAAYRGLVPDDYLDELSYEHREARFQESLAASTEETYLLEAQGQILGLVTVGTGHDSELDGARIGQIRRLYVAPEHWRKGVGTSLLLWAEHLLRSRGFERATLWVLAGSDQVRRFYKARGYRPAVESKLMSLATPLEAVRYWKELGPDEPTI
jgi:GNAT superfamily N-acetyltransferase